MISEASLKSYTVSILSRQLILEVGINVKDFSMHNLPPLLVLFQVPLNFNQILHTIAYTI